MNLRTTSSAGVVLLSALLLAACGGAPVPLPQPEDCGPRNCGGCCDASGACRDGVDAAACGQGGESCRGCATGEICEAAQCVQDPYAGCPDPGDGLPPPRSDFAAAFDPEQGELILFGGDPGVPVNCQARPEFSADTWFYSTACGTWRKSARAGPPARARHVGVFDAQRRRFVVFGGRFRAGTSGAYTVYNETWALHLTADPATHVWDLVTTQGVPPPPLSSSAAVYDPVGDRMLVYGGNQSSSGAVFAPESRVWALSFADDSWEELTPLSVALPKARLFHGAAMDVARNRLIIFGGGDENAFLGPFLKDTWAFDLATRTWTQLGFNAGPQGRIRPMLAPDPERDRLVLFGGHDDGQLGERNDLWALELATGTWQPLREGDTFGTAGSGFCDFPSDFTQPDLGSPERREASGFVQVPGAGHFLLGGRSDCGVLNDVWQLAPEQAAWTELQPSFTGLSCERSGKQGCTKLCF
jgi:hypothetical protein